MDKAGAPPTEAGTDGPPAAVVAAIMAAVAAYDARLRPVAIREAWPAPSAWRWVGRREAMEGGWPW